MRKHRLEIRVLCVLQEVKHSGEGIESEDIEGGCIESDGIGGKDIDGEGQGD